MSRRVRYGAIALAMIAALVVAGCDGGEGPTPTPTETTASPTTEDPTTAETSEAPTPPEVEAPTPAPEVTTDDHVGAIYAAKYFIDLYAYIRHTGDTGQFVAMSAPVCEFCASAVERATEIHETGGWVEGGELEFDIDAATAELPTADEPSYLVRFAATELPTVTHLGDGSTSEKAGGGLQVVVALQYINERFVVFGVNSE